MSAAQVGFGLYGALLVEDPDDGVGVADELTIVLSDIGFDRHGVLGVARQRRAGGHGVRPRRRRTSWPTARIMPTLRARSGAPQRWRIVNAAKSRFFLLDLEGQPFTCIGGDGGLQERPRRRDIAARHAGRARGRHRDADRAARRRRSSLRALLYNRGYGSVEYRDVEDVLTDRVQPMSRRCPRRSCRPCIADIARAEPDGRDARGRGPHAAASWRRRQVRVPASTACRSGRRKPYLGQGRRDADLDGARTRRKWAHPFHLHGFFFLPLDDTAASRFGRWRGRTRSTCRSTARSASSWCFDERPGMWMFHCHILDHADGGLMGHVHLMGRHE